MTFRQRLALVAAGMAATVAIQSAAAAQVYRVPSAAMAPTLEAGALILVDAYARGTLPQAGDVVMLKGSRDPETLFVKRIEGLPGDRVQMVGGRLVSNGVVVERTAEEPYPNPVRNGPALVERWRETLPNGASYSTLNSEDGGILDDTETFFVPDGYYFVMGDNRDNSGDSRLPEAGIGFVPLAHILGHVVSMPAVGERI